MSRLPTLDVQVVDLDIQVVDLDIEVADLDVQVADLDVEVADLDVQVANLDIQVADLDVEVVDLDVQVADLDVEVSYLQFEVSGRRDDRAKAESLPPERPQHLRARAAAGSFSRRDRRRVDEHNVLRARSAVSHQALDLRARQHRIRPRRRSELLSGRSP